MKRNFILLLYFVMGTVLAVAQNTKHNYPDPEFNNEVNFLEKDTAYTAQRLEKNSSKLESKTKMGGLGGAENGYYIDGERSTVRLHNRGQFSFIFSTGASSATGGISQKDSMMLANGMDPSMVQGMAGMGMNDPANINLYKAESGKGKRKVLTMKAGGAVPFGGKPKSADKITFSLKKIREGYWEMVIDKPLGKGEYVFTMMNMGMGSMDGSSTLFAFGID